MKIPSLVAEIFIETSRTWMITTYLPQHTLELGVGAKKQRKKKKTRIIKDKSEKSETV